MRLVSLIDQEPLDGKLWILQESGQRIGEPQGASPMAKLKGAEGDAR